MVSHEEWHQKYFDRVIVMQDGKSVSGGDSPENAGPSPG
jgi:ABC-type lipoprotein export system ATPase subunit